MILRQLGDLALDLDAVVLGEPAERQVEDVGRLDVGQVEDRHEAFLGLGPVLAGPDQLDDLVDVDEREHEAVEQVHAVGGLAAAELRAPADDVDAVVEVDLEHLLEAQGAGLAVDERDGVDAERALHRGALVELLEDRLGDEPVLDLDDEVEPLVAVA